jgi:predicted alpha-1,2-mannosidase
MISCQKVAEPVSYGKADLIDPMIGTGGHGHTYPGATVPFGMVQLSPDNGMSGWDWSSGYHYSDSIIVGFSHTHLSGTGIGDLCDILLMPVEGDVDLENAPSDPRERTYAAKYSHEDEYAYAGLYQVNLGNGIGVELTASERFGMHRYHFPTQERGVVIDLEYAVNWDQPTSAGLRMVGDSSLVGHRYSTGWAKDQRVYFAAKFSDKIQQLTVYDNAREMANNGSWEAERLMAKLLFPKSEQPLLVKVGISSASIEGAEKALQEAPNWDFDHWVDRARSAWSVEMEKFTIVSDNQEALESFYTAYYHTCLAPVHYSDALGNYKAADGAISSVSFDRYDIFSLWDTFRAAHPLFTITQPDRVSDFIQSMLAHHQESGLLPVWSLLGNETNTMTGYHAIPVILDAYLKEHRGFDASQAYDAMKESAMQDIRGTDYYREYGYIPHDLDGQSVTRTLEYAYDDWCVAQMAFVVGEMDDYEYFMDRSQNYRNLFDSGTGFMRAKLSNGKWKTPFYPAYADHNFEVAEYTEGNAWQHSWFVPHDVADLIHLHGGNESFITKLDAMFEDTTGIKGANASVDITGLIGQYAHGNEPSHHIPYLYNYAGVPWKTQERVREILKAQYSAKPDGLAGNEDCGQMSAWYVFSALGFYPVNPAEGVYVIGSPLFPRVDIDVGDGKRFRIKALYNTPENIYIQAATLDQDPLTRSFLWHWEIMQGGELVLEMGPLPNYLHWSDPDAFPPSASDPDRDF